MTRTVRNIFIGAVMPWLLAAPVYTTAQAPSDEEIRALEQQIEKKETEQAEAKKKAEAEKKQVEEEASKQAAEERRKQEEEAAKQAEETKKKEEQDKRAKYSALITEAEQAVSNGDQELAVAKYKEALALYPDEVAPKAGLAEAEKLPDKTCREFPGEWDWQRTGSMVVNPNHTVQGSALFISWSGTWTCDAKTHLVEIKTNHQDFSGVLKEDGCLTGSDGYGSGCWRKKSGKDGKTQDNM